MKCIAHRGYSIKFRDNSIEAIREAVHREYDGVEIDVQLCGTGEIVLHHDVYLGDQFVSDMSLEQLREKGVCTLKDVYDEVPEIRRRLLLIDIKGNNLSITGALMEFYKTEPTRNVSFVVSTERFCTIFHTDSKKVQLSRQLFTRVNTTT